jgi:nitrate/TMAO reductase-like tetraheme cytochrome c subunit
VATAIPHEVSCSSCHLPTGAGLGVVLVDVSLTEGIAHARATLVIWIGLSTLGGLGAAWLMAGRPLPTWRPAALAWPSLRWPGQPRPNVLGWAALLAGAVVVGSGGWFAVHLENDNAFCAACHTEPETTFYQRTLSPAVDLASRHAAEGLACITCHSGAGAVGRGGALLLGARNLAAYLVGGYGQPTRALTPLPDEHCVKCHSASESDTRLERHYHYYLAAWQRARPDDSGTCAACHLSHHTDGLADRGFLNDAATEQICARCHGSAAP